MRPSTTRARHARSIVGKIVLALAVASMLAGVSVQPALGDDHDKRDAQQERYQRQHQPVRHGHQPVYRGGYQPYGYYYYSPPVIYAPPPVVYVPPPSPGISLFFGLPFGHRY